MTSFFPFLAQSQPGPGMFNFVFLLFMIGAMYFLVFAPQRKKQKEHEKMVKELTNGDEIVTSGGILATIVAVKEDRLVVRSADSTKFELGRSFVSQVLKKADK